MPAKSNDVGQIRQQLLKKMQLCGFTTNREALLLLEDHYKSSMATNKYESMDDFICKLNHVVIFETDSDSSAIDSDLATIAVQKLCNQHLKEQQKQLGNSRELEVGEQQVRDSQANAEHAETVEKQVPPGNGLTVRVKNVECSVESRQQIIGSSAASLVNRIEQSDFSIHYKFLHKKLSSLPIFRDDFKLTDLATLSGSRQPSIRCICFGLLVKDLTKIDSYTLIDNTGRVPVRITPDTNFRNRLAYLNCLVLVEGVYVNPDDVLFAANIGLPPVLLDPITDKTLACQEEKMIIVLKEIYLDDDDVCKAMDLLFMGYDSLADSPILFIMIGDFTRNPCLPNELRFYTKRLMRIIRKYSNLKESHFVFIPGPRDACKLIDVELCDDKSMPKVPLTKEQVPINLLTMSGFTNVHLATNPCHIYIGDRQISIVCHSYIKELRKNLLHDLSDRNDELFETAKQILLSNAHLAGGISKTYQHSMNLWNRPDLLVLADTEAFGNKYDYTSSKSSDTSFMTLPSFSRQSNQFKVYYLTSGVIDDSEVSLDALKEIEEHSGDEEESHEGATTAERDLSNDD